jgi:hypothetical protein
MALERVSWETGAGSVLPEARRLWTKGSMRRLRMPSSSKGRSSVGERFAGTRGSVPIEAPAPATSAPAPAPTPAPAPPL